MFCCARMRGLEAAAVIVGDGPLRAALEQQADALGVGDRVFFRGTLSEDALAEWYARLRRVRCCRR